MEKMILGAFCLVLSLGAVAQKATPQYVVVDEKIKEDVIQAAAARYAKGDDMKEAAFRTLIGDAFTEYFGHKKTRAEVFSRDSVNMLNKKLAESSETIRKLNTRLSQDKTKELLDAKDKECKNRCDSITRLFDGDIAQKSRECDSLQRILAETQGRLSELNTRQAAMEQNAAVFRNIEKKLSDLQMALNQAYAVCSTNSLSSIGNIDEMEGAVKSYSDFMEMLDQNIPEEQKEHIALIQSTCKVVEYYHKASLLLDGKYDKAAVEKSQREYSAVEPYLKTMNARQAADVARVNELLVREKNVMLNFRKFVLGDLQELGCIPDETAREAAMEVIRKRLSIFNAGDPNCKEGYYDNGYVYINRQLDKLYSGLKDYRKNNLGEPKAFERFLNGISDSLGDKTGS